MPRLRTIVAVSLFAFLGVPLLCAQREGFVGVWQGHMQVNNRDVAVTVTFMADGEYSQQMVDSLGVRVMEMGHYTFPAANRMHWNVERWEPNNQPKPPGTVYEYSFQNSKTLSLRDVNFGGSIRLTKQRDVWEPSYAGFTVSRLLGPICASDTAYGCLNPRCIQHRDPSLRLKNAFAQHDGKVHMVLSS